MLMKAKFRAFRPRDLIDVGTAAQRLGVTRPTVYRWIDDHTLNFVRDDATGRVFVVRRDVENLLRVAAELSKTTPEEG